MILTHNRMRVVACFAATRILNCIFYFVTAAASPYDGIARLVVVPVIFTDDGAYLAVKIYRNIRTWKNGL